jgi:hypothetical protein
VNILIKKAKHIRRYKYTTEQNLEPNEGALEGLQESLFAYEEVKDRNGEPERGSEWEPIKILLEGDRDSNKMNTTSNTHLQLNYPSWSRPRSHWSATHQPSNPKHANTHSGNLYGLLPVLHRSDRCLRRSDRWTEPVRPVDTIAAQQMFQRASNRRGVLDLSVSGDNFDLVVVDPHDPTIRARLEAPMQSLNQLPMVTNLAGARSA